MRRILCYKNELSWPRNAGHDVALYHLMQEFAALGATVGFAVRQRPDLRAIEGLRLDLLHVLGREGARTGPVEFRWLQERFRSYWGVSPGVVGELGALAEEFQADAVVVSGLNALPMLGGLRCPVRIWHAGDEWVLHHLSQVKASKPRSWPELKPGVVKGLYERAYGSRLERVWVVTGPDAKAMRWATGVGEVDILPNGVDADAYQAVSATEVPNSAIFWGHLGFGPNIQALEWFFESGAWTELRKRHADATFTVMGFSPGPRVRSLEAVPGVELLADVPDIRPVVSAHAVVVLPIVSGAGIKNKLLEAAALARPIVCTRRAMLGLKGDPPVTCAETSDEFVQEISRLWQSADARRAEGGAARSWVTREHSWASAARVALAGIEASLATAGHP